MTIHLNQGHIAALIIALAFFIWMGAGSLSDDAPFENPRPLVMDSGLTRVQVERMKGELVNRDITISAHTAANRRVELKSEIRGKVIAIHKDKGAAVKEGELLLELDARDWPARVKQAEANLQQRQLEARSARQLSERGLANESQLAQAATALANAEAELTNARIQLNATKIRAPFTGIVDQRMVEIGDFVKDSSPLLTVLDFTPFLVKGQVSERDAADINIGDAGFAELINGDRVDGRVRFIAAEADAKTRTFPLELEISNPGGSMTSGLTAKLHIPQPATYAYFISPALLILDDEGQLGLKGIDEQNRVVFRGVNLLKADNKGIWVYGLGSEANIITVGQGFVEYGQQVEPVYMQDTEISAQPEAPKDDADATALSAG
ncbi:MULTISPECIES: efflux RND transporter periplasmic adaptor subunit [Thalassolituus]|jgi:multidrug efflux system membrane fusion protein|uniref:efflux RND transporter periplasmic adaptor subunit n=1 Tax=Thalassolituus TaxID=187492 RepID=UPI001CE2509C|nr:MULTISPECIES: efflux RND transporter periplasmic adaptor subunit [Thalassolituus]MBU2039410.1 efflux RND transporter periplasmic adaptor subunit [Gammaproteobacteria bacterium]MCA6059662.1 efflux RND transporter periplasmic adaptor subunit [Thalassolituus sp. ST750PaO-4]MCB2423154.1 efflux RND transporter periplasmic adaptor subunit [Thalassolituus alkanivorans]